jgi:predicted GNAT family N-acyltransferase
MNRHSSQPCFVIQEVSWETAQSQLRRIRQRVFIEEQLVPVELEWDGLDEKAIHLLAVDAEDNSIGCARIVDNGVIGRMAVLQAWRGQGAGQALLDAAIECCRRRGWRKVTLSAQTHAIPFYERAGFIVYSGEYLDAGIPHRDMRLELSI